MSSPVDTIKNICPFSCLNFNILNYSKTHDIHKISLVISYKTWNSLGKRRASDWLREYKKGFKQVKHKLYTR